MSQLLTDDDKNAIIIASLITGVITGGIASVTVLGVCLIFLTVPQSIGVAIISFWPVFILAAKSNMKLCVAKIKKQRDEVTP